MLLSRVLSYVIKPRIYVILRGGLGNQLHQIAAGANWAEKRGFRLIIFSHIVDTANNPDRRGLFRELNINAVFPNVTISEPNQFENFLLRLANLNSFKLVKSCMVSENNFFDVKKLPIALLRGWFQSIGFLPSSIDITRMVPARISDFHDLSVHVRLTDFLTIDPTPLNSEYYESAISFVENLSTSGFITCFSDDISSAQKMLPSDRAYFYPELNKALNAYELLIELASSKTLIASKSTLCWWAGLYVVSNGGRVISPLEGPTPSDLWVQLNNLK